MRTFLRHINPTIVRAGLLIGALILMSAGCGVKAPPVPPDAKPPGVAGVCRISSEAYPDHTQFDQKSNYYDAKSKNEEPRWSMVDVQFVERFDEVVPLETLKNDSTLEGMRVIQKGSRLSVQPVEKAHFKRVLKLAQAKTKIR